MARRRAFSNAQARRAAEGARGVQDQHRPRPREAARDNRRDGARRDAAREGVDRHPASRGLARRVLRRHPARRGRHLLRQGVLLPGGVERPRVARRTQHAHQGRERGDAREQLNLHRLPAPVRVLPRSREETRRHNGQDGLPHRADPPSVPRPDDIRRDGRVRLPVRRDRLPLRRPRDGGVRRVHDSARPVPRAHRRGARAARARGASSGRTSSSSTSATPR